jgi:hypothetical protein
VPEYACGVSDPVAVDKPWMPAPIMT